MKVKFISHQPGTKVFFASATQLNKAEGIWIQYLENTVLKVSFPNSLYLMIDHITDPAGKFAFEFWYLDQDTNEAKEDPIDGYELELQELNGKLDSLSIILPSFCSQKISRVVTNFNTWRRRPDRNCPNSTLHLHQLAQREKTQLGSGDIA